MTVPRSHRPVDTGVGVLDRSMAIVHAVDSGARSLGGIAGAAGLPRSTAHRLVHALVRHGVLRFEGGVGYRLGPLLHRLGTRAGGDRSLADIGRPILEGLTETTGESSQLYVRIDDERVCIAAVESPNELRTIVEVGAELPLTLGSAGKVFLAWAHHGDLDAMFAEGHDATLERRLATVRRRGWAQSAGEREPGVGSVSAPVRGRDGEVVAAVSVSGPVARMRGAHAKRYAAAVLAAAREIESSLGYDPGR